MKSILTTIAIVLFITSSIRAQSTLTDSLQAYYPFNGGSLADASGNGHTATSLGATTANGYTGDANGSYVTSSAAIRITNHSDITGYAEFTLAAWVYPTSQVTHATILAKVTPNRDFDLKLSNGKPSVHFASGSTYYTCTSPSTLPLNQWSQVTATWSGSIFRIYVNGELKNTANHSGHSPPWTGGLMHIGTLTGTSERFQGRIDEVRVYNRVLTNCEIVLLYDSIPIDTSVIVQNDSLFALDSTASFQWLACDSSMMPLNGATSQFLAPVVNGHYAVELTKKICVDTSACKYLELAPPNLNPSITGISNQIMCMNDTLGPKYVQISDENPDTVIISTTSSNPSLIPPGNILFGGSGATRSIHLIPLQNQTGSASIWVYATDEYSQQDSTTFDVTVNDCYIGVRDDQKSSIQVLPNPSNDRVFVRGAKPGQSFVMYNAAGTEVRKDRFGPDMSIHVSDLKDGMYFLRVSGISGSMKILVKND